MSPSFPYITIYLPIALARSASSQLSSGHKAHKPSSDHPGPMYAHSARYCEPVIRDVEGLGDDAAWRCCGDQPYSTPRGSGKNRGYGTWRPLTSLQVPPLATATSPRSPRFSSGFSPHTSRTHLQSGAVPSAPNLLHDERWRERGRDCSRGPGPSGGDITFPSSLQKMRSSPPPQKTSMVFQRFRKSLGTNVVVELLDSAHDSHQHASAPAPVQAQGASARAGTELSSQGRAGGGRVSVVLRDETAGTTHTLAKQLRNPRKAAHDASHAARCVEWSEESKVRGRGRGRQGQLHLFGEGYVEDGHLACFADAS